MTRRAFTLVEVLVTVIIVGVLMTALLQGFISLWKSQGSTTNMTTAQINAQQMVTTIASAFRGSVQCLSTDTGCTVGANIESASATGCTIYSRNSSGTKVETTYAVNSGNFQTSVNGGTASTVYTGATLTLTYYTSPTYYTTSMTAFTPTAATASTTVAVQITGSITQGNITSKYTTLVRLRNT